jgi:subfamily B ATP-binding cassette protein MsbA
MTNIAYVLRFGWSYLRKYWVRLSASIILGILFGLSNASFVWASKTLTERFDPNAKAREKTSTKQGFFAKHLNDLNLQANRWVDPWLPRFGQKLTWRQIVGGLVFLPLLVSIRSAADYLSSYCMGWVSERVIRDLRLDLMEKLSSLSLDFFNRSRTGDLITRINVDSANLLRSLRAGGADLLKQSITVIAVFLGLCWMDWKLTACAIILLPLCLFPLIVLGKKARRAIKASMKANVMQSSQLVELLAGIRVIKAYNLEAEEVARFRRTSGQLVRQGMKGVQAKELINPIIEVISMVGLGAFCLYCFYTERSGAELVAFMTGLILFFVPIKKLAGLHIIFEQATVSVTRLIEILQEEPTVKNPVNPKPFREFRSAISFEKVTFGYTGCEVLKDFSLNIPRGFRLGIVGASGSGKTTVVNLLFRFYDPWKGAVKIDGRDLREMSIFDLRQQMALVSQDVVLFDQTVAENIACGRLGASRAEIEAAARSAFAHEFIMQLPLGYESPVGERGVSLSGGQRQRIAIARAFIRDAPILVLDEATAALDSNAEAEVQVAIDRLAEHRTVICVAHRLSTLANMEELIVLSEGRIIERGSFQELLQAGELFASLASKQGITLTSVG